MNYGTRRWIFQVYTYFGRVLAEFPIGEELHHHALERARLRCRELEQQGTATWIRLV